MSAPVPGEPSEQAARALRDADQQRPDGRRVYIAGPMTGLPATVSDVEELEPRP